MTKIPLKEYLASRSQSELADSVDLSQGAISKMLRTGRNVFVIQTENKGIELFEEKPLAKSKKQPGSQLNV